MEAIHAHLKEAQEAHLKFKEKGAKTQATKARSSLLSIRKKCDEMRREILAESKKNQEEKNNSKQKKKTPKKKKSKK